MIRTIKESRGYKRENKLFNILKGSKIYNNIKNILNNLKDEEINSIDSFKDLVDIVKNKMSYNESKYIRENIFNDIGDFLVENGLKFLYGIGFSIGFSIAGLGVALMVLLIMSEINSHKLINRFNDKTQSEIKSNIDTLNQKFDNINIPLDNIIKDIKNKKIILGTIKNSNDIYYIDKVKNMEDINKIEILKNKNIKNLMNDITLIKYNNGDIMLYPIKYTNDTQFILLPGYNNIPIIIFQ